MTAAMWEVEVPKMEDKIRKAGLPALQPEQKQTIIEYLDRNAGTAVASASQSLFRGGELR